MPKAFMFYQVAGGNSGGVSEKTSLLKGVSYRQRLAVGPVAARCAQGLFPGPFCPFEEISESVTGRYRMGYPSFYTQSVGDYFDARVSGFAGGITLVIFAPGSEGQFLGPILRHFAVSQGVDLEGEVLIGLRFNAMGNCQGLVHIRHQADVDALASFCDPGLGHQHETRPAFQSGREQVPTGTYRKDGTEIFVPGAPLGRRRAVPELIPA